MIRYLFQFLFLVVVYTITWLAGLMAGLSVFPTETVITDSSAALDPMILAVASLHVLILRTYVHHARPDLLWPRTVFISFGLTYLITQVESLWFIGSLGMDRNMVLGLMTGGFISSLLFCWALVRVSGKPVLQRMSAASQAFSISWKNLGLLALLVIVVWPLLYFLAGYYIAWQSADIRMYYTGSEEIRSFIDMMVVNLQDGLYTFQVFRGFLWVLLAWLILSPITHHPVWIRILLTGGLFAVLGSSQLLLANPLMPESVRYVHLIETAVSTFLFGGLLALWPGFSRRRSPELSAV